MIREYKQEDLNDILDIANKHIGNDYVNTIKDIIDSSECWVVEDILGIRSFIIYKKEDIFDILAFTDIEDEFTLSSFRKFKDIIVNRTNTIVINFTKNKEKLARAIKPYGGFIVSNYIIVPKKEDNE